MHKCLGVLLSILSFDEGYLIRFYPSIPCNCSHIPRFLLTGPALFSIPFLFMYLWLCRTWLVRCLKPTLLDVPRSCSQPPTPKRTRPFSDPEDFWAQISPKWDPLPPATAPPIACLSRTPRLHEAQLPRLQQPYQDQRSDPTFDHGIVTLFQMCL